MKPKRKPSDLPAHLPAHLHAERDDAPAGELRLRVNLLGFERAAHLLRTAGARFITVLLADTPEPALLAAFALRGELLTLSAPTKRSDPVVYGSIGAGWPAARWAEQELVERHGVHPVGFEARRALRLPTPTGSTGR